MNVMLPTVVYVLTKTVTNLNDFYYDTVVGVYEDKRLLVEDVAKDIGTYSTYEDYEVDENYMYWYYYNCDDEYDIAYHGYEMSIVRKES